VELLQTIPPLFAVRLAFVPPLASGNIPVSEVVKSTLPHNGAAPTPPLIRTFPVATSASRANEVAVLA
jgi:hypothetical protein